MNVQPFADTYALRGSDDSFLWLNTKTSSQIENQSKSQRGVEFINSLKQKKIASNGCPKRTIMAILPQYFPTVCTQVLPYQTQMTAQMDPESHVVVGG